MRFGSSWSRFCSIRRVAFATPAASATRLVRVWKACSICSTRGCGTSTCRASWVFPPARRVGAGCTSGSSGASGRRRWRCWSPNSTNRNASIGHGWSSMPRSSTRKRGRQSRAKPGQSRLSVQQVPPRRRRPGLAARSAARSGQRKRTCALATADRRAQRRRLPAKRGLGRPRILLGTTSRGASRTRDHTADQQTAPARRTASRRPNRTNRHSRTQTRSSPQRPASPPPLGRRTHQRLATPLPPTQHPHRTQQPRLPRLPHDRPHPHPRTRILSSLPDTNARLAREPYRGAAAVDVLVGARPLVLARVEVLRAQVGPAGDDRLEQRGILDRRSEHLGGE